MANLKDIASELGVSVSTVSRALNDSDEISVEMKEKVRETAVSLGYTLRGRGGRVTPEWNAAGIIVPEVASEYYAKIVHMSKEMLADKGYSTIIKVTDFADMPAIEREMMFVKVQAEGPARSEILRTVEIFRCKVVDVSSSEMTIEATGDHDKLDAILSLLHRFGIKEVARTGSVAMRRSKKCE